MIKIVFAPGCYGTYLSRCVYNYTELRSGDYHPFAFDATGSSHIHRENLDSASKILTGHLGNFAWDNNDQLVVIIPNQDNMLDYYNNQYVKEARQGLTWYISQQWPEWSIKEKLEQGWQYTGPINDTIPKWIIREYTSYWIWRCLVTSYSPDKYQNLLSSISVPTDWLFENFLEHFKTICQSLNLSINIDDNFIVENHKNFIKAQRFHQCQSRIEQWVSCIIDGKENIISPCQTLFDESLVQHLLRLHGYEIQCQGLNNFPTNSIDIKKLIYTI